MGSLVVLVVVAIVVESTTVVDTLFCELTKPIGLWIQIDRSNRDSVRRMAHYDMNRDWLFVSLEMDHSSVSLHLTVHLSLIHRNADILKYIYNNKVCVCVRARAIIGAKEMWIEEENEGTGRKKKNVEARERNRPAATMYYALRRRFVIFYFHFCSFPHCSVPSSLSLFLSVFRLSFFLLRSLTHTHTLSLWALVASHVAKRKDLLFFLSWAAR